MSVPDPKKIAGEFSRRKTAGEVRFVKDRGGDKSEWAWASTGPSNREIGGEFKFNPKFLKPLAQTLRSVLMALGHATSAHAKLVKIKSRNVSPDGNLGGKGYIQKIPDMRRQLMNVIEVLSATSDTIHDELNAPHWSDKKEKLDPRERDEVKDIIEDAETIKDDPEEWAEEEEEEFDEESNGKPGKKQSHGKRTASTLNVIANHDPSVLLESVMARTAALRVAYGRPVELERTMMGIADIYTELQAVNRSLSRLEN